MSRRSWQVTRRIGASPQAVVEAAFRPIVTRFADPVDPRAEQRVIRWESVPDVVEQVERVARVRQEQGESVLELQSTWKLPLPYFRLIIAPLVASSLRRSLDHMANVIEARATGTADPDPPRRPVWAPRDRLGAEQAAAIATICAVLAITGYAGSLFTQTIHYVAESYEAADAQLGQVLALTRLGTLIGLVGAVLSDRRGRRQMLILAVLGVCLSGLASAFAPNLGTFGVFQVFSRGFVNLVAVVGYISITEEASEGGRAYMLAVASVAGASGFALGALLLPVADLGPEAWRGLFGLSGLALLLVPGLIRNLPESRRYVAMGDRLAASRTGELVDEFYGRRFAVVAATGFLMNFFAAPASQFTNRYLADEHGYTGLAILALRFFTQGAPALVAVWIGGRIAESSGRKPVAARATFVVAVTTAAFFLTGGPMLWLALLVSTVAGALSGPSFAAFNTELFPTEVRGRAGGGLLVIAVSGAVAGLLLAGYLSGALEGIGRAVAVTTAAPLIVALVLIRLLPEARGRNLDDVSPPEV